MSLVKVAIVDDFQGVALEMADWTVLNGRAEVTVFRDHISEFQDVVERLLPFDVICAMRERTPLRRPLLERLPNLRLIVSTGRRNSAIDLAAAKERGIVVCGTEYIGHGVAELTWALIMAAMKHIPDESASVRNGGWQTRIGRDMKGRTIGLVGLGNVGSVVARYAQAFDMNIIAWSTNLTEVTANQYGARLVSKEQLFREADIASVHLVLSERTKHIIGALELGLMKRTAYLVNTSRGPLVDEAALIEVLERQTIAGAALDVFDIEPLPAVHPFRSLPNVLATPHIGFVTQDTYKLFYQDTVEDILAWLEGRPIREMT